MALLDRGQLAQLLNVRRDQIDDLVQSGAIPRASVQADGSLRFDSTGEAIAALLAKTQRQRRGDDVPSANEHVDEIKARVGRENE